MARACGSSRRHPRHGRLNAQVGAAPGSRSVVAREWTSVDAGMGGPGSHEGRFDLGVPTGGGEAEAVNTRCKVRREMLT